MPTTAANTKFTTPGLSQEDAAKVVEMMQDRLNACTDLHLTLKHIHWNVVGPHFIGVHEMLDPQVDTAREFADEIAERIATYGASPIGTPGALVKARSWDEYSLGRAGTQAHLAALDQVYTGVLESYREQVEALDDIDLVTQDMFIAHINAFEKFHWFVRAHLESDTGALVDAGATSEKEAAAAADAGDHDAFGN